MDDAVVESVRPTGLTRRNILVMILLTLVTLGFYYPAWFLRRRDALNRLDSPTKLSRWPFVVALAFFVLRFVVVFASAPARPEETLGAGGSLFLTLLQLAVGILLLVQCFQIKDILEDHLAGPDDQVSSSFLAEKVTLSGLMTFFFTIFYLQYIINRDIAGHDRAAFAPIANQ